MKNQKNTQKPETKKGIPGGFLFFVFLILFIFMAINSLTDKNLAEISFSHQIEHLVNLDLIQPSENKKIAQNDHLVTFSGKFKEQLSPESNERFAYLELLNQHQQYLSDLKQLQSDIRYSQKEVQSSAEYFLGLTGMSIPEKGFVVVGNVYDTTSQSNAIIVKNVQNLDVNLSDVKQKIELLQSNVTEKGVLELGEEMNTLVGLYMSTKLGVGQDPYKTNLKEMKSKLATSGSYDTLFNVYKEVYADLAALSMQFLKMHDGARLTPLRSVRNYLEQLNQYSVVLKDYQKNSLLLEKARQNVVNVIWFFNNQEVSTKMLEKQDSEVFNQWFVQAKKEWNQFSKNKGLTFKAPDQPRNVVLEKTFKSKQPAPNYFGYIVTILPILLIIFALFFIFSRQMKGVGSSAMNFGKSPAKLLTKETNKVTFNDVAGAEEAKEELHEIVDFLKDPYKFTALGARIPKGVLLVGPPGTGKTLVAKAVAGEADRPFFSISGSDFVEMFVGVGASRIRDLFDQGRKNAPCIIFVDEIDAVGRHRGAGIGGGHDEREQTLNQLLVEMDGFDTKEGVILMAATNRPDILDKALLRPGRFDRRVVLDLPDVKGRFEILKVHARKIKIDPSVNLMDIAKNTPGASGADLANILNEAALMAARRGRSAVTSAEAIEACDKVRYGKERKSLEIDVDEKKTTAYHESGHAIVGLCVEHADPVDKVTIIPRGFSLGATHFMPEKNRLNYWRREVVDQLAICMGGRAAEEIFVKDMSSGASQDINQATKLARAMVCEWGMSELGLITYDEKETAGQYLGQNGYASKKYSESTAEKIDAEVSKILDEAHKKALQIVEDHKDKVELMTQMLMEFETLDKQDIKEIMDGTWDIEKKRKRVDTAESLQMAPKPPPIPEDKKEENIPPKLDQPPTEA